MAKRSTPARLQDKFIVRLPPGLRDRIKAAADRNGMSMNEAVVWCLEVFFPAPRSLESKLDELTTMVAMLKSGGDGYVGIDRLIDEIHRTVEKIANGKIETSVDFKSNVEDTLSQWRMDQMKHGPDEFYTPFTEDDRRDLEEAVSKHLRGDAKKTSD